jgi:hypothetical protein
MGLFGKSKKKDLATDQMKILLDKFEFMDLETFCNDIVKEKPLLDMEHLSKIQFLEFIWEKYRKGQIQFSQIKEFAINLGIVTENFFE